MVQCAGEVKLSCFLMFHYDDMITELIDSRKRPSDALRSQCRERVDVYLSKKSSSWKTLFLVTSKSVCMLTKKPNCTETAPILKTPTYVGQGLSGH